MSLRILLADESSTIKKAFEIGLNSYGVEIKNVQHGIDVLEVAEHFNPDIVFADVLISKMNGYEVCSQIKQHKELSQIPVVLMWSGFMDIDEDKYFTSQANGKLEKPFSADQLMHLIQSLVQKPIGERLAETSSKGFSKAASSDTPPPLSPHSLRPNLKVAEEQVKSISITDDLLLKGDLESEDNDYNSDDGEEVEEFSLDEFKALDLHDRDDDSDTSSDFSDDYKEITAIPTLEEEQQLLQKLNEDTDIRHGINLSDLDKGDGPSNPNFDMSSLADESSPEITDTSGVSEFNPAQDLSDVFGEELNPDNQDFKDLLSDDQDSISRDSKTIHRNVDDIHNSDMGLLPSAEGLPSDRGESVSNLSTPENKSKSNASFVQQLSKDEIKKIVQEQAKEVIQSIVWELVPELSKQMIEKEIKRLLADSDPN